MSGTVIPGGGQALYSPRPISGEREGLPPLTASSPLCSAASQAVPDVSQGDGTSWETPAQTFLRQWQSSRSQEQHRKLPHPQSSQKSIHTCPAHLGPQGFVIGPRVPVCNPHDPLLCHTKIHNSALASGVRRCSRNWASALQDTLMS